MFRNFSLIFRNLNDSLLFHRCIQSDSLKMCTVYEKMSLYFPNDIYSNLNTKTEKIKKIKNPFLHVERKKKKIV